MTIKMTKFIKFKEKWEPNKESVHKQQTLYQLRLKKKLRVKALYLKVLL